MTGNIVGERFVLVSFGESHGKCIGAVIEGCPAGLKLSEEDILKVPLIISTTSPSFLWVVTMD